MIDGEVFRDQQFGFGLGCNSGINPIAIPDGGYHIGQNVVSRGGLIQTRPGYRSVFNLPCGRLQGFTLFKPTDGSTHMVAAVAGEIYISAAPFETYRKLEGIAFNANAERVVFCATIQTQYFDGAGFIVNRDRPLDILIMQDGSTRAAMWNGSVARHLVPTVSGKVDPESGEIITKPRRDETPVGLWMAWAGNRLWVSRGNEVFASDINNPLKFTEAKYLAEGRSFTMPERVTGMIQPASGSELIVFGQTTITFLKANILDRRAWLNTPEFQKTFTGIGCIAGKSIVNQLGLTWWYSQTGWTNLNFALQTMNDSKVRYLDEPMQASKSYLHPNRSFICAADIENYILISVPFSSSHNKHTWVLDTEGEAYKWDGWWTGTSPVEWGVESIDGVQRAFYASVDNDGVNRIWEAFQPDRTDNGEPITCFFTTRHHTFATPGPKQFDFAEFFLQEVYSTVDVWSGVATRNGSYRQTLVKRVEATDGPIDAGDTYTDTDTLSSNRTQFRRIRTQAIDPSANDLCNGCGVETDWPYPVDREFSIMLMWSGRMAVDGYRLWALARADVEEGYCETDETGPRAVNAEGCSGTTEVVGTTAFTRYTSEQSFEAVCPRGTEPVVSVTALAGSYSYISQADADRKATGRAKLLALGEVDCQRRIGLTDEAGNWLTDELGNALIYTENA